MAVNLFGFKIGKEEKETKLENLPSFVPPAQDDGSITVAEGGAFGTTVDLENTVKNESQLITKYREMAQQPEAEKAVDDIINEAIVADNNQAPVEIVLDDVEVSAAIKDKIRDEFDYILKLMKFNYRAYDIFRNWYVDGRLFYHIVIDVKNPRAGIKELRHVDPRKIKKVRKEKRNQKARVGEISLAKRYDEFYIYQSKGITSEGEGLKIAPDSIAYCNSGLLDTKNYTVLSYLHKALKPLNQLRMLEDATVIYRLARAPERRIFYIDVGNLPKAKAEQYLRDMMVKHKNKLVYDANTGEVRDDRKFLTMLEDYWLPRREGGRGTEITTLPGGQNLGEMDDVNYFKNKLYEALNVPTTRLQADGAFNLGRASEITRDELKFSRFVGRLRTRFSEIFHILLERQLLLKGVITAAEWKEIQDNIHYDFMEDNHFAELKDSEVLENRLRLLQDVDQYTGKYFSTAWIQKNVLRQSEEEIEQINQEIEDEGDGEIDNDEFN